MAKGQTAELLGIIKRRPVGKGAWRVDVCDVIDDFKEMVAAFRAISNRHPNDSETIAFVNKGLFAGLEAIDKLNTMLYYKDPENGQEEDTKANGTNHRDAGGGDSDQESHER